MSNQAIDSFLSKIQQDSTGLKGYNARIQFNFTDTKDTVLVSFDGNSAHIATDAQAPDCAVMISTDILKQLTMGQLNPQTAFLMGKLTAKGDMRHITRLGSILTYYS